MQISYTGNKIPSNFISRTLVRNEKKKYVYIYYSSLIIITIIYNYSHNSQFLRNQNISNNFARLSTFQTNYTPSPTRSNYLHTFPTLHHHFTPSLPSSHHHLPFTPHISVYHRLKSKVHPDIIQPCKENRSKKKATFSRGKKRRKKKTNKPALSLPRTSRGIESSRTIEAGQKDRPIKKNVWLAKTKERRASFEDSSSGVIRLGTNKRGRGVEGE